MAMKHLSPLMNESVERSSSISIWIALEQRHVNSRPYRFTSFLPFFVRNGPKQSIPVNVKGSCWFESLPWQVCHSLCFHWPVHLSTGDTPVDVFGDCLASSQDPVAVGVDLV